MLKFIALLLASVIAQTDSSCWSQSEAVGGNSTSNIVVVNNLDQLVNLPEGYRISMINVCNFQQQLNGVQISVNVWNETAQTFGGSKDQIALNAIGLMNGTCTKYTLTQPITQIRIGYDNNQVRGIFWQMADDTYYSSSTSSPPYRQTFNFTNNSPLMGIVGYQTQNQRQIVKLGVVKYECVLKADLNTRPIYITGFTADRNAKKGGYNQDSYEREMLMLIWMWSLQMMMSLYTRECNAELDLISCDSKEPSKWIMIVAFLLGFIFLLICFLTLFWVFYWDKRKEIKKEKKALSAVQISEEKSNPSKPQLKRITSQQRVVSRYVTETISTQENKRTLVTEVDDGVGKILRTEDILLKNDNLQRGKNGPNSQGWDSSNKKSEAFTSRSLIESDAVLPVKSDALQ